MEWQTQTNRVVCTKGFNTKNRFEQKHNYLNTVKKFGRFMNVHFSYLAYLRGHLERFYREVIETVIVFFDWSLFRDYNMQL